MSDPSETIDAMLAHDKKVRIAIERSRQLAANAVVGTERVAATKRMELILSGDAIKLTRTRDLDLVNDLTGEVEQAAERNVGGEDQGIADAIRVQ